MPSQRTHSAYAEIVEGLLPKASTICELGAGSGTDTLYFLDHGHSVIAVDISDKALGLLSENAKKKHLDKNLTMVQADLGDHALPFEDNSLDIVYSRLSLQYFPREVTTLILKEIKRILRPGGVGFIAVKSPEDAKEMQFFRQTAREESQGVFIDNGQIKSRFSIKDWETMLQNARISQFTVRSFTEDMSNKIDEVKSGNSKFLLTEIKIVK